MMSGMFTLMMTMDVKKSYATMKTSLKRSHINHKLQDFKFQWTYQSTFISILTLLNQLVTPFRRICLFVFFSLYLFPYAIGYSNQSWPIIGLSQTLCHTLLTHGTISVLPVQTKFTLTFDAISMSNMPINFNDKYLTNVSYEELRWKFLTSLCSRLSMLLGRNE